MNEYEMKRGFQDNLKTEKLRELMQEAFGSVQEKDGKLVATYGALKELRAWQSGKKLAVDTTMDTTVDNDTAAGTIKAYNTFLEKVTGLTAKERGKRAQKAAKEGKA